MHNCSYAREVQELDPRFVFIFENFPLIKIDMTLVQNREIVVFPNRKSAGFTSMLVEMCPVVMLPEPSEV